MKKNEYVMYVVMFMKEMQRRRNAHSVTHPLLNLQSSLEKKLGLQSMW